MSQTPLSGEDAEAQVASYLREHPDFLERHAELLSELVLVDPRQGRAISLVERQALLLRERIRALELQLSDLVRAGRANDDLALRLTRWCSGLLAETRPSGRAAVATEGLRLHFEIPHVAMRLWTEGSRSGDEPSRLLADGMQAPYCGPQAGFEPVAWLGADAAAVRSVALVALRRPGQERSFGLLVLGSPDVSRFELGMGTHLLARVGQMLSAALDVPGARPE
jgi:uncharacterized protein YigA (DUF484 family)